MLERPQSIDSDPEADAVSVVRLRRSLGVVDVALFFIVAGSNLQWVTTAARAGASSLVVWIVGALTMFVPIALVVVYLSSLYPEEGGMYVWSKRAFGPFAGFMTGWTYWTSNLPYFPALLYFAAGNALYVTGGDGGSLANSPAFFIAVALAGLIIGTVVNILGLSVGKWLTNIGAISRWIATLLLIGLGAFVWFRFGPATVIDATTVRPALELKNLIFWSVIAFAWVGPEAISFMAGEIKQPRRAIAVGLTVAAPVIAAIYVLGTASVLALLPAGDVNPSSGVMQALARASTRLGWPALTPVAAVLVAVSCMGSVGAWLGAAARIPFVAGVDRYLPASFGRMHPRYGSPMTALVVQSAIAAIFIVLGQSGTTVKGAYDVLVSTTVIITLLPFIYLFASAIRLGPVAANERAARIPGGRRTIVAASALGLLTTVCAIALALVPAEDDPTKLLTFVKIVGMTLLTVGAGVALYVSAPGRRERKTLLSPASIGEP
ncbi:MAG: APC family permease [Candidatus Eremiobacteraeota bacterium]|nr:APC family permease [Candidatus Eremiobacteraeota bacterium]